MAKIVQRFENMEMTTDGVLIGCADNFELSTETEMTDVTCKASNGWRDQEPGEQSWSATASGVMTVYTTPDVTGNYGYEQMMAAKINKTKVALTWGPDTVGAVSYGGDAYITSVTLTAERGGRQSYSVSYTGSGPIVPTVNA